MAAIEALSRDPRDSRLGVRPVKPTTGHQAYTVPVGQGLLLFVVDDADLLIRLEAFYWNL